MSEGTGTLMISELEKADEGIYQCKASNRYGTSLSKKVQLVKATIGIFKEKDKDVKRYRVVPAISLKVTCNPPESDPPGKTKWVKYIKDETDTRSVQLDDRVAVDDDGMLVFCCCIFLFFFSLLRLNKLPHIIYWKIYFHFEACQLCDLDIPREKWLNYLHSAASFCYFSTETYIMGIH